MVIVCLNSVIFCSQCCGCCQRDCVIFTNHFIFIFLFSSCQTSVNSSHTSTPPNTQHYPFNWNKFRNSNSNSNIIILFLIPIESTWKFFSLKREPFWFVLELAILHQQAISITMVYIEHQDDNSNDIDVDDVSDTLWNTAWKLAQIAWVV